MSTSWSIFVIVLIVINVGGCGWLIWWTMHMRTDEQSEGELSTGHTWDGDLKENNNPLPKWWLNTFYLTIIFTIVYLVLYPGFGNFSGTLGWSQYDQYENEMTASAEKLDDIYAAFREQDLMSLSKDDAALSIGRNVFMNVCAACHGSDARGAKGFPNLTDNDWLYGGSPETVYASIANGRTGIMAPMGAVVGDEGADAIIEFLRSDNPDSAPAAAGKQKFMTSGCIGCHGLNAEGNPALGGPNLRDDIWLHGDSNADIKNIIMNGKINEMPAQLDLLGEDRVRLVTAYVLSLSR